MRRLGVMLSLTAAIAAGCGGGEDPSAARTVKLVTHDSFSISESVLDDFENRTGIAIQIVQSGDAGEMVTRLALTKGKPVGDVAFGVDNTFLSRALEEDVFVPYQSPRLVYVNDEYLLDDKFRVTPVDRGEVCINYDLRRFGADGPPAPSSLSDLTDPKYRNQLVVQNPATSSPGLAFLLATIERFGEPGWEDYWRKLKANGVEVASGWEEAYNDRFSAGGGNGDRPMVVSYASSPPAAVHFAADPGAPATTAALEDGCFRQIEFAGILKGTEREDDAKRVIDFLLSAEFQEDMPLNMFVFPVRNGTELPPVFEEHAAQPEEVLEMAPNRIEANRERWIERWTSLMSG
jgi:thiamine transport system substrate-binding protein